MNLISRTEEMLLLVVCRLEDEAVGLTIRKEVEAVTGTRYSVGGVYVPLDRLVRKGLLRAEEGQPSSERMGRPRRTYRVTARGLEALREARAFHDELWTSLPEPVLSRLQIA